MARSSVIAAQLPPGVGKSAILRALQLEYGGHIVTISNGLQDQYEETYPDLSVLRGGNQYDCASSAPLKCSEVKALGVTLCETCPYRQARKNCAEGVPTLANPASYYYVSLLKTFKEPDVLLIDEAHRIYDMALMFVDCCFNCGEYDVPNTVHTLPEFTAWAPAIVAKLKAAGEALLKSGEPKKAEHMARKSYKLASLLEEIEAEAENFVIYRETKPFRGKPAEYLCVRPLKAPTRILRRLLSAKKIILVSATLFRSDVERLFPGRPFEYLDFPSPIPKMQRPVYLAPVAARVNKDTPPSKVADWIREWRMKLPDRNTLVHVSYVWAERLRPFFAPGEALFNTKEDKAITIARFKAEGGLFIASGCAEGLDLPGDQCRLNLIPILHRENLGDVIVDKRLALPGGERAHMLETLKTLMQQTGRGNRGPTDESITIVGDPMLPYLINTHRKDIPPSYLESIQWGRKPNGIRL